jgi:hypothetical protein
MEFWCFIIGFNVEFNEDNVIRHRKKVIAEYGNISEATLQRAKGWAIIFGVILLDTGLYR